MLRQTRTARRSRGQATTEFVLLVSLVAIPLYMALRAMMGAVLREFFTSLIDRFTQG